MLPIPDYRVLWTWDFATCWDDSCIVRERGCSGKNGRRTAFLSDYRRLIDYASLHHFNGVVIWGAVRAHQHGFEQLKELVKYGREKGVRVMPGVSAFSYGGVCYDPRTRFDGMFDFPPEEHPYSLWTWLQKHPEYTAVDRSGRPYDYGPFNIAACPSRPETLEWFKEGLQWLYEEFDVDGIQVEVGDYALCHCPVCTERRKNVPVGPHYCVSDMVATYTAATEVSKACKKDAWVLCETYCDVANQKTAPDDADWYGWHSMAQSDRERLAALPSDSILQWGVDKSLGGCARDTWEGDIYTPAKDNVLRIHAGSQWAQNGPADWGVNLVWELVRNARTHGLNGVSVFGEESAFAPPNEANYLALEEASGLGAPNPDCDEALFYRQTLDPLYGGDGFAAAWRTLYVRGSMLYLGERLNRKKGSTQLLEDLTGDPDFRRKALAMTPSEKAAALDKYYDEARSVSRTLSGDVCRRWSWLEDSLSRMKWNVERS